MLTEAATRLHILRTKGIDPAAMFIARHSNPLERRTPLPREEPVHEHRTPTAPTLIIVSGLSGSGKSVALKTFEDQDYYCSDNLPIQLLPDFVRSLLANHDGSAPRRLAVGIDVRGQADLSQRATGGSWPPMPAWK